MSKEKKDSSVEKPSVEKVGEPTNVITTVNVDKAGNLYVPSLIRKKIEVEAHSLYVVKLLSFENDVATIQFRRLRE